MDQRINPFQFLFKKKEEPTSDIIPYIREDLHIVNGGFNYYENFGLAQEYKGFIIVVRYIQKNLIDGQQSGLDIYTKRWMKHLFTIHGKLFTDVYEETIAKIDDICESLKGETNEV